MKMKRILYVGSLVLTTMAFADTAKVSVFIQDSDTHEPLANVPVVGYFRIDAGWYAVNGGPLPNKSTALTDKNGCCRISGRTNCGSVGCWVEEPPSGYYRPLAGWGHKFLNKNIFGVWQPDNLVATIGLQRVVHPIPLFVKHVGAYGYGMNFDGNSREDLFSKGNGVLQFDFMKGEWLPPIGNGEIADVEFRRLPHEDLGEGVNGAGVKGRSYRDSMSVKFLGKDNGLVEMETWHDAGLKVRMAPAEGFSQDLLCWYAIGKDLQPFDNFKKERSFCFRIRTRRNDKGEIVEAYYGKIYGDIQMLAMVSPYVPVASVRMLYYLNPRNLDRNLEWNRQNLCYDPLYPRSNDSFKYRWFREESAP